MPYFPGLSPAEQISEEHAQLLALINNMGDGFIAVNGAGSITLVNSMALSITDNNLLVGKPLEDVLKLIDKTGKPVDIKAAVLTSTTGYTNRDWRLNFTDASTINVQITVSPVRSGYGQTSDGGFVVLLRDITKEKSIEQERDEFISVASHELRTPVAVAEGSIDNAKILSDKSDIPVAIKSAITAAHEQVVFLGTLINDLSMISRSDQEKAYESLETFSVADLLDSLATDFRPQAAKKKLTLNIQAKEGLGLITSNRLYLHEMLQNFLSNAIKYTEKGVVELTAQPDGNNVLFSVADSGIGIGRNEQNKLFSKFFRSTDWRVRQNTGTGLGLYVSAKLARLIGANITVQSELNKGTRFNLLVPNLVKPVAH